MFKEMRVGKIMSVDQYDAANSAPVPLSQLTATPAFEPVPLGRTPWPSREDLQRLSDQAHKEGYAKGLNEAREQIEADRKREALAVQHLLEGLARPYDDINDQLLDELTRLAMATGALLARRELTIEPDALKDIIAEALRALPDPDVSTEVSVHPDDYALITDALQAEHPNLTLLADNELERGDCQVRGGASEIDGRLNSQLEQLINTAGGLS